jgi:hypothetical protein
MALAILLRPMALDNGIGKENNLKTTVLVDFIPL